MRPSAAGRRRSPSRACRIRWCRSTPEEFVLRTPDKQNATMLVREALPLTDSRPDYPDVHARQLACSARAAARACGCACARPKACRTTCAPASTGTRTSRTRLAGERDLRAAEPRQGRGGLPRRGGASAEGRLHRRELDEAKKGLLSARSLARSQDGNLAAALVNNLYLGRTFRSRSRSTRRSPRRRSPMSTRRCASTCSRRIRARLRRRLQVAALTRGTKSRR